MRAPYFLSSLLVLTLASCSSFPTGNGKAKVETLTFSPLKELGIKGKELAEKVEAAKKAGDKSREYLASELFIQGNDASVRGDYEDSSKLFKYVIELVPNNPYLKKKLAFELIRKGETKEAEKILEEVFAASNMKDETAGLILASIYSSLEKNKDARQLYQRLLSINPGSEEACLYLARSYAGEKLYREAHNLLARCEKRAETASAFLFFRGKMEYDRGFKKEAKKFFERALKADPEYGQAALGVGALLEEQEDFTAAIGVYKKFLSDKDNSDNKDVLSHLVALMFSLEKNAEVIPYAEELSSLDGSDLNLKVRLALLYSSNERYADAIKLFKEVLEVVPDSDKVLYYLGALYQQIKEPRVALEYFSKIAVASPLYGDAGLQVGQILAAQAKADYAEGKTEFVTKFNDFVEKQSKKSPDLLMDLKMLQATFYEDTFQYKTAIQVLESAKTDKSFTEGHSYYLASIFEKNGQYKEARSLVQGIVDKDPNNAHALNFLGYSYLEKNEKMDRAFEYISKALSLKPDDGYIRDSMAWYYYQTGNFKEALVQAKKAMELVKDDPTITKHLGMIYQRLHHYDKAKHYLTEALENAQAQSERDDVLKLLEDMENKRAPAEASFNP